MNEIEPLLEQAAQDPTIGASLTAIGGIAAYAAGSLYVYDRAEKMLEDQEQQFVEDYINDLTPEEYGESIVKDQIWDWKHPVKAKKVTAAERKLKQLKDEYDTESYLEKDWEYHNQHLERDIEIEE